MTLVNAGHINPGVVGVAGTLVEAVTNARSGLPLGLVPGYKYESVGVNLAAGESLLLYTDGVTDAENPAGLRFGVAGVTGALDDGVAGATPSRPAALGGRLVAAVQLHAAGTPQSDDIAVVCLGRPLVPGPPPTSRIRPGGDR